jgi:hypothetical protein
MAEIIVPVSMQFGLPLVFESKILAPVLNVPIVPDSSELYVILFHVKLYTEELFA